MTDLLVCYPIQYDECGCSVEYVEIWLEGMSVYPYTMCTVYALEGDFEFG